MVTTAACGCTVRCTLSTCMLSTLLQSTVIQSANLVNNLLSLNFKISKFYSLQFDEKNLLPLHSAMLDWHASCKP